jgi:hypothetical protein
MVINVIQPFGKEQNAGVRKELKLTGFLKIFPGYFSEVLQKAQELSNTNRFLARNLDTRIQAAEYGLTILLVKLWAKDYNNNLNKTSAAPVTCCCRVCCRGRWNWKEQNHELIPK